MTHRVEKSRPNGWIFSAILVSFGLTFGPNSSAAEQKPSHMPEATRTSVGDLVVVGGPSPTEQEISGTYEEETPGVLGGISGGAAAGSPSVQAGPVNVSVPIYGLQLPAAILGGISGGAKRQMQGDLPYRNGRTALWRRRPFGHGILYRP